MANDEVIIRNPLALNEDALGNNYYIPLEQNVSEYPPDAVAIGESWIKAVRSVSQADGYVEDGAGDDSKVPEVVE